MFGAEIHRPDHQPLILSPSIEAREATTEEEIEHRDIPEEEGNKKHSAKHVQFADTDTDSISLLAHGGIDTYNILFPNGERGIMAPAQNAPGPKSVPRKRLNSSAFDDLVGCHLAVEINRHDVPETPINAVTELRAGLIQKPFFISTLKLLTTSPYFETLQSQTYVITGSKSIPGPFLFPELDPYSFELFDLWMQGIRLGGPSGFFSMNHYLELYVVAWKFQIESLRNITMDLIRNYYRKNDMTAPPFRLEYVYRHTSRPCAMRDFLVNTAAYRASTAANGSEAISASMRAVLHKGGDLAQDYCAALCQLARNYNRDARKDDACDWHEHHQTNRINCDVHM